MNRTIKTILEGAVGFAALIGVGWLGYSVGKEVARTEYEYKLMMRQLQARGQVDLVSIAPPKKQGKLRKLFKIVKDGELHIEVKPKDA